MPSVVSPDLGAADIPVAHTPRGGYGATFPEPLLAQCGEPLVAGAPDLRGLWQVTAVEVKGIPAPKTHPAFKHFERIEQCGDAWSSPAVG